MSSYSWVLLFFVTSAYAATLPLPPYMKPCGRKDPNFRACAVKRANEVIPNIINGDSKYKIPNMNPLVIEKLKIGEGRARQSGITFAIRDIKVYNISTSIVDDVIIDFDKKHTHLDITVPYIEIEAIYEVGGRILILPISGKGKANITSADIKVGFDVDYTLEKMDGNEHVKFKNPKVQLQTNRVYIHLDNLFNGDKFLGEQMNQFLNENWRDAYHAVSPSIIGVLTELLTSLLNSIASTMTYDTLFPETIS